jgi:hypothetical protein
MSHKQSDTRGHSQARDAITAERDLATEHAMDALDYLRVQMRKTGMPDCADVLDEAFIRCLQIYIAQKHRDLAASSSDLTGAGDNTVN